MKSFVVVALMASFFAVDLTQSMDPCDDKVTAEKWEGGMKCAKESPDFEQFAKKMTECLKKANGGTDIDPKFEKMKETICKDDKKVQKEATKCAFPDGKVPPPDSKVEECVKKL